MGGGEQEILITGLAGSTRGWPDEMSSSARRTAFSVAVDELEEALGEVSLGGGDFFVDG